MSHADGLIVGRMETLMITTFFKPNVNNVQAAFLSWNGKQIERINLSNGKSTAHIKLDKVLGGTSSNSITHGATNCAQVLFDAYKKAISLIAKSIVEEKPCQDLLPILENAGWEIYPS